MQLGMVGLGKMGANMTRRMLRGGHELVVSDLSPDAVKGLVGEGAVGSASLDEFVSKLKAPRAAWIMVPAGGPTEATVQKLAQHMQAGDAIIFATARERSGAGAAAPHRCLAFERWRGSPFAIGQTSAEGKGDLAKCRRNPSSEAPDDPSPFGRPGAVRRDRRSCA